MLIGLDIGLRISSSALVAGWVRHGTLHVVHFETVQAGVGAYAGTYPLTYRDIVLWAQNLFQGMGPCTVMVDKWAGTPFKQVCGSDMVRVETDYGSPYVSLSKIVEQERIRVSSDAPFTLGQILSHTDGREALERLVVLSGITPDSILADL